MSPIQDLISDIWKNRDLLKDPSLQQTIISVIDDLDKGLLRVAYPTPDGQWIINEWVKKAIVLYFLIRPITTQQVGIFEYHDRMMLKYGYESLGVRVVPPAVARYGAYLAKGVILMPSYINIGAYVGEGTMIDTWATVGSCAQIGMHVHLSGGVGVGGVLEPLQALPVIIGDGAFIGSRCILVEGARIGNRAVLGANVTITGSSKIVDVSGSGGPKEYKGYVPDDSVVIPGTISKVFPAGIYQVPCALIVGKRKASTDLKTSLNYALRDNGVSI